MSNTLGQASKYAYSVAYAGLMLLGVVDSSGHCQGLRKADGNANIPESAGGVITSG